MTTKITTKTYEIRQSVTVRTRPTLQGFVAWRTEVDGPDGLSIKEGTCPAGNEPMQNGTSQRDDCFKSSVLLPPKALERIRTEGCQLLPTYEIAGSVISRAIYLWPSMPATGGPYTASVLEFPRGRAMT